MRSCQRHAESRLPCFLRRLLVVAIVAIGCQMSLGPTTGFAQDTQEADPLFDDQTSLQTLLPLIDDSSAALPELDLPGLSSYAPADRTIPLTGLEAGELYLDARLTDEGGPLENGLIWRVFGVQAEADGRLPLIASARGGAARFDLEPGSYLVHAAFGRASASARIDIGVETRRQSMVLNAGGLKLDAMLPDGSPVRRQRLSFDIFDQGNDGERKLILPAVAPGQIVRLPAGTYHIVSKYGEVNAAIRADLHVEPGELTEASIEHRAALVTLNLVRDETGFPLADTAWSVVGPSGDVIAEHVGAYPTMILASGDYTVVARNRDQLWQETITVRPGRDLTFRVVADPETAIAAE